MRLTKRTADDLFNITVQTLVTRETPLMPEDLAHLADTLDELADKIRMLAIAQAAENPETVIKH